MTNNSQHELPNVDLIAGNKSLQGTITILNDDNQVLSAKTAEFIYQTGMGIRLLKLLTHSSRDVAEQIVDLGNLISSSSPDTKVTISALTQRYDEECLGKKVTDCNKVIKSFCNQNGWGFIKHPNIDESCVNNQKLHLNEKDIAILASNLVNHIVH